MTRVNILRASAGSGKTFRLVLKYICDVLKKPECYCNILAITFTNKATEEMKSRIINELHKLADNQPSDYLEEIKKRTGFNEEKIRAQAVVARTKIIHDYSRFSVLTIDKFFQRILRAFINELSLDLDYNIELDTSTLLERSADDLINSISEENKAELKKQLEEFAKKRLDEGDKWDMRNDLRTLGKELFKDSIAKHVGSDMNKDEIDSVIKKLKESRDKIKKLGKEGVELLKAKGLCAGDFKGSNPTFITCFEEYMNGKFKEPPTSNMRKAADNIDEWYSKSKKNEKIEEVKAVAEKLQPKLSEICKLYDENIHDINTLNLIEKNYQSYILLNDLHQSLMDICKKENIMILDKTKDILREFIKDVNAPFIYEKVGSRFDHHMIDEFQDTSKREWNNLKPLLHEALSSNEDASVFIVGDIKQSIYRWRGGHWKLLNHDIIEDFKSHDPNIEPLELNRRSYENIVNFNNMIISKVVERDNEFVNGEINKERNKGITEAECDKLNNTISNAYNKFEQKAHHVGKQGIAEVTLFDSKTEPPFIEAIKDAISRGYRYKDILILVRSVRGEYNNKSDGEKVVEALCAYKETLIANNQPVFNILTSDSLKINSYDVVNFIIAVMRLAVNPYDNIERGIYNGYLKRSYGEAFNDDELATLSKIAHLSALEAFELIVKHFELHTNSKDVAYLQAVHELILSFSNNHIADIQHFLAWWDESGSDKTLSVEMSDDTIEITTIHKAKGLERDVVIIPYCKWGMIPNPSKPQIIWASANEKDKTLKNIGKYPITYGPSMKNSAFSEEYWKEFVMSHMDGINLLYVAVTRAKKELYMYVPTGNDYSNISGIIEEVLPKMDKMQHDEPIRNDDNKVMYQRYYYGEKIEHNTPKDDKQGDGNFLLKDYPTHSTKVNIYKKLNRFTKEGSKPGTTACDKGIKMHKAFEGANTIDDLYKSIEQMVNNGYIKQTEAKKLRADIDKATDNKLVSEWFSGEWDVVKCEEEILCQGITHRPDRVMIKGDRVVVVDYKFGAVPNKDHHEQVKGYISALQNMGCYNTIEGYVWYVHLNKIEASTQE